MKVPQEDYSNVRAKLWREVGPFYLDYYESVQLPYHLQDIQWLQSADQETNGYRIFNLLFSAQADQNSFLSVVKVLYPKEDTEINPEEIINFNRNLNSLPPFQAAP
jgi:hypothetical protein